MDAFASDELRFPSKRDGWFMIVIWLSAMATTVFSVFLLLLPVPLAVSISTALILLASWAFTLWSVYTVVYTLTQDQLLIRFGPFHSHVKLSSILEISPSHSLLSSPACSLDRLRVTYGSSRRRSSNVLISPRDKSEFIAALIRRTPHLILQDDGVARAEGLDEPDRRRKHTDGPGSV